MRCDGEQVNSETPWDIGEKDIISAAVQASYRFFEWRDMHTMQNRQSRASLGEAWSVQLPLPFLETVQIMKSSWVLTISITTHLVSVNCSFCIFKQCNYL